MLQIFTADEQPCISHENSVCQDQNLEHQESHNDLINNEDTGDVITEEIITKFKRRYEEGYDLYGPLYQKWLDVNNLGSSSLSSIVETFEC